MFRSRLLLKGFTALYFGTVIGLTFVPAATELRTSWFWPLIAFVPVGMVLTLLLGRHRWWVAIGFGVLGAAWVEAAQTVWMPAGYADPIDVLWSAGGVALGVVIALAITTPMRRIARSHDSPRRVTQAGQQELP